MDKVRDNFETYRNDVDDVLYYNPEDLNRQIDEEEIENARKEARQKGLEEGRKEGRLEGIDKGIEKERLSAVKNMLDNNLEDENIMKYLGLSKECLENIKNKLIS